MYDPLNAYCVVGFTRKSGYVCLFGSANILPYYLCLHLQRCLVSVLLMATEYDTNFRDHPECYRYQSGEQGVFKVEPYKSELLPSWKYKDEEAAKASVRELREQYAAYREDEDFVGMDMARKYLQMGFTRAMRYAKYPGGKKYDDEGNENEPQQWADEDKRAAAVVFRDAWQEVKDDETYQRLKEHHIEHVYQASKSPM